MIPTESKHPGGTVGVITNELTRYTMFAISLSALWIPKGTMLSWQVGQWIEHGLNQIVLTRKGEWVWFMGDDHQFPQDVLLRLLDRNVDVVVPLVCIRKPPFAAVVYTPNPPGHQQKYAAVPWEAMPREGMFTEVNGVSVRTGTAGMLIRSHVFEKLAYPWFECGKTNPEGPGEDLWLCEKLIAAGLRIHVDTETAIGHTVPMTAWPARNRRREHIISLDMGNEFHLQFKAEDGGLSPVDDEEGEPSGGGDDE